MLKRKEFTLENGTVIKEPFSFKWLIVAIVLGLLWLSIKVTGFDIVTLMKRGNQFFVIIARMFPINTSYLPRIVYPMIATIAMSLVGTMIAAFVALPVSYFCAENLFENRVARVVLRTFFSIFRTIPLLIIALMLTFIFGLGTFAGTVAICLFTFSIIVKMTYEQLELADMGPFDAMLSMGSGRFTAFWVAIVPQVLGFYISTVYYNLEVNVRSAAMLGYVGAGGIGLLLDAATGLKRYQDVGAILVIMFIVVFIIENISKFMRRSLL